MVSEITFNPAGAAYGKQASQADVVDIAEDLAELQHLIDDVAMSVPLLSGGYSRGFNESLQLLQLRYASQAEQVRLAQAGTPQRRLNTLVEQVRSQHISLKSELRVAYRHLGTLLCDADWQSPVYAASGSLELNRLNSGIKEHVLDYKRDGHLEQAPYEQKFAAEYASHLGSSKLQAYVTSCGMSAFSSIMQWLIFELGMGTAALAIEPMYFENIHLSKAYLPEMVRISAPSSEDLLTALRVNQPSIVICDAITNCGAVLEHDITTAIKWASQEASHTVALVIDTTCLPSVLLPSNLLQNLPDNVCVVLIESLAKYHQFGMDTVTGGVAMLHADEAMHNSFRKSRARLGANIADSSVGCLPTPDRERLTQRMQRHSRNTSALVNHLEGSIKDNVGVLESVSWLQEAAQCANIEDFRGTCFSLTFRPQFRSIACYREFEEKVVDIAAERKLNITLGTSFGFDATRLYVTAPSTVFEPPFLRVSVGTETASEIATLAEIMTEVSELLARKWEPQSLAQRFDTTPTSAGPTIVASRFPVKEKAGLAESVFAGDDALHRYLSPQNFPATPLVELPDDLNPYRAEGIRIFAKMMPMVPLMNIKSIPAFSMLTQAAERGDLDGVQKLIESSSSNTVLSLSVLGKLFGIDTTYAIVDHNIAPSLTRMLRLFGIEILMHAGLGHELFGKLAPRSQRAAVIGDQEGWFNPGQYTNPDNPQGFAKWLAPDLWAQTEGKLDMLSCGLGTCGTMVGVSRALREYKADMQIVACCPIAGDAVPGPRERSLLKDVTFPWHDVADAAIELTARDSFIASVKLLRRGIMGGPSSGMNYAGALRYIEQEKQSGRIAEILKEKGEVWCAFLCCDSPLPHVEEYYDELGEDFFPTVHDVPSLDQPLHEPYAI